MLNLTNVLILSPRKINILENLDENAEELDDTNETKEKEASL